MHRFLVFYLFLSFLIAGCFYDSEEDLYPNLNCSTENVSFSKDVQPIINNSCISCHNAADNLGNITLEGYESVLKYADNGSLVGSIKHLSGFSAMPDGSAKLNSCSISKIESWVNAGSPNN